MCVEMKVCTGAYKSTPFRRARLKIILAKIYVVNRSSSFWTDGSSSTPIAPKKISVQPRFLSSWRTGLEICSCSGMAAHFPMDSRIFWELVWPHLWRISCAWSIYMYRILFANRDSSSDGAFSGFIFAFEPFEICALEKVSCLFGRIFFLISSLPGFLLIFSSAMFVSPNRFSFHR